MSGRSTPFRGNDWTGSAAPVPPFGTVGSTISTLPLLSALALKFAEVFRDASGRHDSRSSGADRQLDSLAAGRDGCGAAAADDSADIGTAGKHQFLAAAADRGVGGEAA